MAATSTPEDERMNGRLARAFANPENKEWAAAFFDSGTHAGHGDPAERARHERHVAAVEQLQNDIAADHAAVEYRGALANQSAASRQQIQLEIQKAQSDPAWADAGHKDHTYAIDRVSRLYRQLSSSTK